MMSSSDHQRLNFQFSGQVFWEIKNGRKTRMLRDCAYQANTLDFWAGCDMLGPSIGRQGGCPMWYWQVGDKDAKKVRDASRYFDLARR